MNPVKVVLVVAVSFFFVSGGLFSPSEGFARDFDFIFDQEDEYEEFVEEIGMALSYPAMDPAGPRGVLGWELGVGVTFADIPSSDAMDEAFDGDAPSYLVLPKLVASTGLPYNTDVSGFISHDPSGDVTFAGLAGKWAFIPGGFTTPSVAVRATATQLFGVSEFDLRTLGADLTVSQGFGLAIGGLTPYAGISAVNIRGEEDFDDDQGFGSYSTTEGKFYLGARLDLPGFLDLTAQYDSAFSQDTDLYSIQGTVGF